MKRLLLITFLASLSTFAFAQQYGWVDISDKIPGEYQSSGDNTLVGICFINDTTGWITSASVNQAEIYHTTDGAKTFSTQTTQYPTLSVFMLNSNIGYSGGVNGRIYKTSDAGANWVLHGAIGNTLTDITFPPGSDTGYCCGIEGRIYQITPNGVTHMASNTVVRLDAVSFPVTSEGWACGSNTIRHYSGGIWNTDQTYPSGSYYSIFFVPGTTQGWAVGDQIIYTTDGMNWQIQTNPDTNGRTLRDVFFMDTLNGWIVGEGGLILHTTNGGENWDIMDSGITGILESVYFTSTNNGYAIGDNVLLKYTLISDTDSSNATLSAINIDGTSLENFNSAIYEYSVELLTGTTEIPQITATATITGATVNITQASSLPGTASIVVTAKDGQTQHTYTIHFSVVTSIKDVKQANTLNIYPNPVFKILYFEVPVETTPFELKIIDIHGGVVHSQKSFSAKSIDVSELQAGVYFISLQNKNETYNARFVKK